MKLNLKSASVVLALLAAPIAHAWTYSDGDALLIFRASGYKTVEFNLGNISQFTNVPNGSTITVGGWSQSLVYTNFGTDLTGVSVILTATTSPYSSLGKYSWLTRSSTTEIVAETNTTSGWQSKFYSNINALGTKPILNLVAPATTNAYAIDLSSVDLSASYDYIVTSTGVRAPQIALFGGNASFNVEGVVPDSFAFWRIAPNTPAVYVGTFNITTNGTLTYTAGNGSIAAPVITGITRAGNISSVSFTTTASGGNYWLTYTNTLGDSATNWPSVSGPITGDGSTKTLTHTNSGGTGFYSVKRTP